MLKFIHNAFDTRCQMKCPMWPNVVCFAPSPLRFGGGGAGGAARQIACELQT